MEYLESIIIGINTKNLIVFCQLWLNENEYKSKREDLFKDNKSYEYLCSFKKELIYLKEKVISHLVDHSPDDYNNRLRLAKAKSGKFSPGHGFRYGYV